MEEKALPQELLSRASVSPGGEHAWKMEDVPKVIEAAKAAGLANLGGQPQFQGPIGTAEPYWLNFEPTEINNNESWQQYVNRAASETLESFSRLFKETDFEYEGCQNWKHIKEAKEKGMNINEHLWFVLYFDDNSTHHRDRSKEVIMARKYIDCRELPSEMNCTVAISADSEEELLEAAVQHAVTVHGHEDSPELRSQLRGGFKEGSPPL